ncbi:multicopper oxidase domain-containing protein [Rubrobacter tropicus]|uniref:Multicopper oxidase domain-containing protein n=1 Tax=Rubrobacter tropicus TaxID=2653851 RepID=A0A6G8QDD8_9ACTN|nr:multicopper oxidase domain-containing protein [Rubrobacter tropicus]
MRESRRPPRLTRRGFIGMAGLGAGALVLGGCGVLSPARQNPPTARSASRIAEYALEASALELDLGGRKVSTWGYGKDLPGPEIRLKQDEILRVEVRNRLPEDTTIHWHGLPVPNRMDGVAGVTQEPIKPEGDFVYEFEVPVSGSYMYHSHVGTQLDRGLYGPLIVEPRNETLSYDREYTLVLDDWLDGVRGTPEEEMEKLKSDRGAMADMEGMEGMLGTEGGDAPPQWPPDVVYPMYLINGKPPDSPEELEVRRGEKVRLRLLNPSSATIYRVALQGHRMTVTHTDGQPVEPVEVETIRIGMGERYDVLVEASNPGAWQLAAHAEGTEKQARAVFRYRGAKDPRPRPDQRPAELAGRMLYYDALRATQEAGAPESGSPDRVLPITLNGDEETYVWTINGQAFPDADPIEAGRGERVRFEMENTTMMPHPMHLHGHFFRVDNGTGRGPIKDTVLVDPKQRLAFDWLADNPGDWAFHCHQIYHAERGMTRIIKVA